MKHFDRIGFNFNRSVDFEIESKRTFYGKTFRNVDGTSSYKSMLGVPVHYKEETLNPDSPFIDIDLEPEVFSDRWEFNSGVYTLTVGDTGEVQYRSRAYGDAVWRPLEIGGSTNLSPNRVYHEPRKYRDFIVFEDIRPGVDMWVRVGSPSVEPLFLVKRSSAPREFVWEIEHSQDSFFTIGPGGRGWEYGTDSPQRELDIRKTDSAPEISRGRRKVISEEVWFGDVWERDDQRNKVRKSNVDYPVLIDPPDITENITATIDDCHQTVGESTIKTGSNSHAFGYVFGAKIDAGVRFRSVPISQGKSLDVANLVLFHPGGFDSFNGRVYGDDVDDAPVWSGLDGPTTITKTSSYFQTSFPGGTPSTVTFDIQNVVQEIVNRTGWASNNDMRFALTRSTDPGGIDLLNFAGYGNAGSNPTAKLEITFTAGPTIHSGIVSFTGSGAATMQGNANLGGVASFTGSGDFSASANLIHAGSANFSGQGSVTASPNVVFGGSISLTGSGSMVALGGLVVDGSVVFGGTGTLQVEGDGFFFHTVRGGTLPGILGHRPRS